MNNINVRAAPGVKVPREGNHRSYIVETDGIVSVPDSVFYLRRISDGDLIEVSEAETLAITGTSNTGGNT